MYTLINETAILLGKVHKTMYRMDIFTCIVHIIKSFNIIVQSNQWQQSGTTAPILNGTESTCMKAQSILTVVVVPG